MAMFKEQDITAEMITAKFPDVASAIVSNASVDTISLSDATAEDIKTANPSLAETLKQEGIEDGAKAETARIASIDAESMPGYESIITEMKADSTKTATDAKLAIFDKMKANAANAATARAEDGKNLAAKTEALSSKADDNTKAEADKIAVDAMAEAGKLVRGEK